MSQIPNTAITVIGIDIGKNSFHVVGHDARGAIVLRQKWSRGQVEAWLANTPPCLIGTGKPASRTPPEPQTRIAWSRCQVDGNAGASRKLSATAGLDRPARDAIDALRAGTKERPLARTKELRG